MYEVRTKSGSLCVCNEELIVVFGGFSSVTIDNLVYQIRINFNNFVIESKIVCVCNMGTFLPRLNSNWGVSVIQQAKHCCWQKV